MELTFVVNAVPVAQPRAKATAINGRARMYEAKKSHPIHDFKASVRMAASAVYQGAPVDSPLSLYLAFFFPRPSNKKWKKRPMPAYSHTGKPDADNLAKAVMDALNKLVWADDSCISDVRIRKMVCAGDQQPHVSVSVMSIEE